MTRLAYAAVLLISGGLTVAVAQENISRPFGSVKVAADKNVGDVSGTNGGVTIEDRAQARNVHTVNGGISIGSHASVESIETVNGKVRVDDNSRVKSIETVNGGVELEAGVQVEQGVKAVNGRIELGNGATVGGSIETVNGSIELDHATVGGDLRSKNANIEVGAQSIVKGGIFMEKRGDRDYGDSKRPPRVVIGPGAVVTGELKFEREVQLYVSDSAKVGSITGAKAIKFSGEKP